MLVHEYGSLENCPKKISGKIIEKDNTSMSEGLRNRLRYLRHMPLTSIFEVCEIQLKVPFISRETLNEFSTDLESRRRKRNRRAREERRREKWIEVEENKKLGKYPEAKCRIESAFHFPQVGATVAISSARYLKRVFQLDENDLDVHHLYRVSLLSYVFHTEKSAGISKHVRNRAFQSHSEISSL